MPAAAPAHLATLVRGDAPEALIRGHCAVVDAHGRLLSGVGDPAVVTTLRSCIKPIQALPLVRIAMDELGLSEAELAIACASHSGEAMHVQTVERLLARVGLDASALSCGPQLPFDDEAARAAIETGEGARPVTNNCSGKHAGMLVACAVAGWPTDGYAAADHPLQVEIRSLLSELCGLDISAQPHGVDGCGLVTHGVPLWALARAFAAGAATEPGFARCQAAMAAHPQMVAGRGRFDSDLLAAAGETLTVKGGGAAVWAAVRRPRGPALAIKLEAGEPTALPVIALAALEAMGWLGAQDPSPALSSHRQGMLRNWAGQPVGSVLVEPAWPAGLVA